MSCKTQLVLVLSNQFLSHAQLGNEWQDPPVNEDSNQAEDGFVQALTLSQTSLKEDFPSRPSYGTAGDSIELWSNFFLLSFAAGKEFFFYEIEISPNIPNTRLTNKAIRRIVRLYLSQEPFRSRVATDYSKFLVSPFDLRQEYDVEEKPRRLVLFWDTQDPPTNVNEEQRNTFYVQLNFKAEQSAKIVQFLRSLRDPTIPRVEQEEIMQSLNMIMSQDAKNRTFGMDPKVMAVGRNRFYRLRDEHPEQPFDLTGGLQAYRGYLLSVRPTAAFARLLVQVKHAASYKQGALKTIIDEFRRDIDSNLKKLDSFLALVKVSTHHLPKKKNREGEDVVRVKTICSLSRKANNSRTKSPFLGANPWQVQFHFDNNPPVQGLRAGWVSVGEYFRHKYSTAVSKNYPVINVGSNGHPSWLPAEVLHVLPGQPVLRELHPWHTAEMIKVAARKAKLNATAVAQDSLKMLGIKPANSSILDEFGINVDPHLTKIQARVLPAPDIEYQKSRFITPQNASWNLKEFELVRPVKIKSWVVLCLKSGDIKDDRWAEHDHLEACIKTFYQTLKKLKITIGEPIKDFGQKKSYRELKVDFRSSKSFVAIEQTLKALPRVDFVLVLVSKEEKPIFNWVKRFGDCQHGLLTRYAVGSKFARNSSQYFANLGLKVNVGLSGVNHLLSQSQNKLSFISQGQTMLVGYDVGHPSDRQRKEAQSVVGIVASIDRYAAQYYGDVAVQSAGKEFVESLKELVKGRLSLWKENNKNELPGNVIFYRDGVGESMYGQVKERELGEITKACGEVYLNRPFPRISFIVVGKRHHVSASTVNCLTAVAS